MSVLPFPPNTTHLTQPLDKGVFGPLKIHGRNKFCSNNAHVEINKYNFCSIFSNVWMQGMTVYNIRNSFLTTGVIHLIVMPLSYPLNHLLHLIFLMTLDNIYHYILPRSLITYVPLLYHQQSLRQVFYLLLHRLYSQSQMMMLCFKRKKYLDLGEWLI